MHDVNNRPAQRRGAKQGEITAYLRDSVMQGRLVPGQRLVEIDLTRELGISRSLLREAFRQLAAEELIEIVPNRGALVRRLTAREACELFQIRAELEALAARLAAGRMDDSGVRQLFEEDIEPIWRESEFISRENYVCENRQFHHAILAASGNSQLVKLNDRLQLSVIMAQISSALTADIIATSLQEHREIARAILDGDGEAAAGILRSHLTRASKLMAQMPANLFRAEEVPAAVQ